MMIISDFKNLPIATNEYEQKVIQFCVSWMNGQEYFTLKTSGSTGEPKPIHLTRKQMEASALLTGKTFGLQAGDRALVCLNVEYIAGTMMLVRGMVLGLELLIVEATSNPLIDLPNLPFDFAAFVPLQLQTILSADDNFLPVLNQMKAIIVGGATVGVQLAEMIQRLKVPVFSTYGMTETVSHIAIRALNGNITDTFQVLEGVRVGVDERNCLNIVAAASNFELIQTNDIVEIVDNQTFRLLGRFDNIINSGGIKIQLEKVENAFEPLLKSLNITRFFAFGIPDDRLGQKLILVLETDYLSEEQKSTLLSSVKTTLSTYQIPKAIFTISTFSETATSKIDKKATIKRLNL